MGRPSVSKSERITDVLERDIRLIRLGLGQQLRSEHQLVRSRVPFTAKLNDVPLRGMKEDSLHSTLAMAELFPDSGEQWAELAYLVAKDASMLGVKTGTPFLQLPRPTRFADQRPLEFVTPLCFAFEILGGHGQAS